MPRIPLTHGRGPLRDGAAAGWDVTDAPLIEGELQVAGHRQQVQFLVDTGASSTSINGAGLGAFEAIYPGDDRLVMTGGVGGEWPGAQYRNAKFVISLPEGDLELAIPLVTILIPYQKLNPANKWVPSLKKPALPPTARPGIASRMRSCRAPNLLGRDVFRTNGLAMRYDPLGSSHIEAQAIAQQAALSA